MPPSMRLCSVKPTSLPSSLPGLLLTTTAPPWPLTGPTLACHGAPICRLTPLAWKSGAAQLPPEGGVSMIPQIDPAGTLTLLMPGLGRTTATGLGPVYGPFGPQLMVNR